MDYITERAHAIYALAHNGGRPDDEDVALYRMYALLSFAKGSGTTASDVHDAYVVWQLTTFPEPRYTVPFDQLTPTVQAYDDKYVDAIHQAAVAGRFGDAPPKVTT